MPDVAEIVMRDYDNETTAMKINVADITAGNLATIQANLAALAADAVDITRGELAETRLKIVTPGTSILPADMEAQIEKGWLVTYTDNQQFLDPPTDTVPNPGFGIPFVVTIPTADYTDHLLTNSDLANLTDAGDVQAFVEAFEALVLSPYGGTVTVVQMRVVGSDN